MSFAGFCIYLFPLLFRKLAELLHTSIGCSLFFPHHITTVARISFFYFLMRSKIHFLEVCKQKETFVCLKKVFCLFLFKLTFAFHVNSTLKKFLLKRSLSLPLLNTNESNLNSIMLLITSLKLGDIWVF